MPTSTATGANQASAAQPGSVGLRQYWATMAAANATINHVTQPNHRRNNRIGRTGELSG